MIMAFPSPSGSSRRGTPSLLPSALARTASGATPSTAVNTQYSQSNAITATPGIIAPEPESSGGEEDEEGEASAIADREDTASQPEEEPPTIQPFFTLIEDASTGTYHHPEVVYVFSDDDGDNIIEAMQRIEQLRATYEASMQPRRESRRASDVASRTFSVPQERYVVVELDAAATGITSAHSLTEDWQILDASVGDAPMLNGGNGDGQRGQADDQRRSMLKIQGVSQIEDHKDRTVGGGDGATVGLSIEDEVRGFLTRMADLKKIVTRAEKDFMLTGHDTAVLNTQGH